MKYNNFCPSCIGIKRLILLRQICMRVRRRELRDCVRKGSVFYEI